MIKLDDNFLAEVGLAALPEPLRNLMLKHVYETLQLRVGLQLADGMSDQELDEFETLTDRGDEEGALAWLEANRPNYKEVVEQNLQELRQEILEVADQILADEDPRRVRGETEA
jgi:hypothetical protein